MGYTNANATKTNGYTSGLVSKVAANSVDLDEGTLVKIDGGYITVAGAGDTIEGVSVTKNVFASDNQTVAMELATYMPANANQWYEMPITGGSVTAADVGKYFDITAAQVVDGASESASTGQLKMEQFISATRGVFSIANL